MIWVQNTVSYPVLNNLKFEEYREEEDMSNWDSDLKYQSLLTRLGSYLLGMQVDHSSGQPRAILQVVFPSNWLIAENDNFIVHGEYLDESETLYVIGGDPEKRQIYLDDTVIYVSDVIKYNDAIEAKKLELAELLRQKEVLLEESIQEHRRKLEDGGIKFREIVVSKPQFEKPTDMQVQYPDIKRHVHEKEEQFDEYSWPLNKAPQPESKANFPKRPSLPEGIDPSIFSNDDDPIDPRELSDEDFMEPQRSSQNIEQVSSVNETKEFHRPKKAEGLKIVNEQSYFSRDQVIRQRHDIDNNF